MGSMGQTWLAVWCVGAGVEKGGLRLRGGLVCRPIIAGGIRARELPRQQRYSGGEQREERGAQRVERGERGPVGRERKGGHSG